MTRGEDGLVEERGCRMRGRLSGEEEEEALLQREVKWTQVGGRCYDAGWNSSQSREASGRTQWMEG